MYFLFFILHGWEKDPLSSRRRLSQSFPMENFVKTPVGY